MDNEGWEIDELAEESGLSAERIRRWTTAESYVSLRDLKKMSARFTRPLSVLLMAEAPATTVPRYWRAGRHGAAGAKLSRGALEVVRRARYVQGNAAEMLDAMNRSAEPSVHRATLNQNPEFVAAENAAALGINPPRLAGQGADRDRKRHNMIREKIESQNVFTMQEKIPEDGMAGFALVDTKPAIILVNWCDPARRRIFTILHEYAHVLLNDGGVCPRFGAREDGGSGAPYIERWCDRFAGAVLMPRDKFVDALRDTHEKAGSNPLRAVSDLADRFCVSGMAAAAQAVRVLDDACLKKEYSRCYGALNRETAKRGEGEGGKKQDFAVRTGQAAMCMARKGRRYARLVAAASESGAISTSTALDYLEIKLKNLDDLKMHCWGGQSDKLLSTQAR